MFRGHYFKKQKMARDGNPVNTFYAWDGEYEVRITEIGIFSVLTKKRRGLGPEKWEEGLYFKLPLIPWTLIETTISFFKSLCGPRNYEAMLYIMWDKENQQYFTYIPQQKVTPVDVDVEHDTKLYREYTPVMQIHSHNKMEAEFSSIDNAEQLETMLYAVIGSLDKFLPDITVRYSCGGHYRKIDPKTVIENPFTDFPRNWEKKVTFKGGTV